MGEEIRRRDDGHFHLQLTYNMIIIYIIRFIYTLQGSMLLHTNIKYDFLQYYIWGEFLLKKKDEIEKVVYNKWIWYCL
jgi:hypothetical protein